MAVVNCDTCGAEARYIVSHVSDGKQEFKCAEHFGGATAPAPPATVPEQCELCETEPVFAVLHLIESNADLALGERCYHLQNRIAWRRLSPEDRATIDTFATEATPTNGELHVVEDQAGDEPVPATVGAESDASVASEG